MYCRQHGRKPTLALWMLVAIADLAILATAAGALLTLSILATLAVVTGGVFALRRLGLQPGRSGGRRSEPTHRRA